jgi:uncharacterized membrane protein HdeD (DUF308 family)
MLQLLLKKWWAILIQGGLMVLLSYFIFQNPASVLAGVSLSVGLIVLLIGGIGLIGWMMTEKEDREGSSLIWSALTAVLGVLMLTHLLLTMRAVTIVFGLWMLVTAYNLLSYAWPRRTDGWMGWLMIVVGLLSIILAILVVINPAIGASWVSIVLGIQVLLSGLALVLLAFIKKAVSKKVEQKIEDLRSQL